LALVGDPEGGRSLVDPPALHPPDSAISEWNRQSYERCFELVFGHPTDVATFARDVAAGT
jgi:hypothetical protein